MELQTKKLRRMEKGESILVCIPSNRFFYNILWLQLLECGLNFMQLKYLLLYLLF